MARSSRNVFTYNGPRQQECTGRGTLSKGQDSTAWHDQGQPHREPEWQDRVQGCLQARQEPPRQQLYQGLEVCCQSNPQALNLKGLVPYRKTQPGRP